MNIIHAGLEHLDEVVPLFDLYRQFYEQAPDAELCRNYMQQRLKADESIVFLAGSGDGAAIGFTQLYATFCSVELIPRLVLYDLYVIKDFRRKGVAKALMDRATQYARDNGYKRLTLETAVDNLPGQALYEKEGWQRDLDFYTYHLPVS